MPAQTVIQVRRDTSSNWTSTNPTLAEGEIGYETNTGKFKIGKMAGSPPALQSWDLLEYATDIDLVTDLGANVAAFLKSPSSSNLATAVTDETGSGSLVFGTSPTITTPALTLSTTASSTAGRIAVDGSTLKLGNGSTTLTFSDDSVINTALATKITNPMTTAGDLIVGGTVTSGVAAPTRLGIGSNGQVLTVSGGAVTWAASTGGGGETISSFLLMGA